MPRIFSYDVYDGNKMVLEKVTSKEIQDHFGTDYANMSLYTRDKKKNRYMGKYILVRHGQGKPEAFLEKENEIPTQMPESWSREWKEACIRIKKGEKMEYLIELIEERKELGKRTAYTKGGSWNDRIEYDRLGQLILEEVYRLYENGEIH